MNDLIKRSDAIEPLKKVISHGVKGKNGKHPISAELMLKYLMNLPSTNRLQGEWKRMKFTDCGLPIHKCSICEHYINGDMEVRNFCPNCGARMKSVDENPLAGIEPKPIPTRKHTFVYQRGIDNE